MPQPFTGQKKTPNKTFDPSTDNVCPTLPFMDMKNMKDTGALQGQSGSDCKSVQGDREQHIKGNMTEDIDKCLTTSVMIDQDWRIYNNLVFVVGGTTRDNRCGFHQQTNWMARTDNFIHTRTETTVSARSSTSQRKTSAGTTR